MAFKVAVDRTKCNGCEKCLEVCTTGLFSIHYGKALPDPDKKCNGCENCVAACGENAITVTDTRVALSETCRSLFKELDELDNETENCRSGGRCATSPGRKKERA